MLYNVRITSTDSKKHVLQKGKISAFGNGFVLKDLKKEWPTVFKVYEKKFDPMKNQVQLIGKLRDFKKDDYFMSLELEDDEAEAYIKSGYNSNGDWVIICIQGQVVADGKQCFNGKVHLKRDPHFYTLVNSEKTILSKGEMGDVFNFFIDMNPTA